MQARVVVNLFDGEVKRRSKESQKMFLIEVCFFERNFEDYFHLPAFGGGGAIFTGLGVLPDLLFWFLFFVF